MTSILLAEAPDLVSAGVVPLDHGSVAVIGAYPIYAFVSRNGFAPFWELGWDRYDPLRPPSSDTVAAGSSGARVLNSQPSKWNKDMRCLDLLMCGVWICWR